MIWPIPGDLVAGQPPVAVPRKLATFCSEAPRRVARLIGDFLASLAAAMPRRLGSRQASQSW